MKALVTKIFADKFTGYVYQEGEIFSCNDKERIDNLASRGLIHVAEEKPIEVNDEIKPATKKVRKK